MNTAFKKMDAVPAHISRKQRAALYGLNAWNKLSVQERAKHAWDCEACARSAHAAQYFGEAVQGEARPWPCSGHSHPYRFSCARHGVFVPRTRGSSAGKRVIDPTLSSAAFLSGF